MGAGLEKEMRLLCAGGGGSGSEGEKDPVSGAQGPCVQRQQWGAQDPGQLLVFCLGGIFRQDQKF